MLGFEKEKDPSLHNFFLDEKFQLNKYWDQVQWEIAASDTYWVDFVVCTIKDMLLNMVYRDGLWVVNNLPKLESFYLNELLPVCFTNEELKQKKLISLWF